jgi:hypothetical protein
MCRSIWSNGTLPYLRLHGFGSGQVIKVTASITSLLRGFLRLIHHSLNYMNLAIFSLVIDHMHSSGGIN